MKKHTLKRIRLFDVILAVFLILLCFVMIYPVWYCFVYSLSDSIRVMIEPVTFLPVGFTLDNYKVVLQNETILQSFFVSVARTVCGIVYTIFITGLASYALSKQTLPGRKFFSWYMLIPMYVSGGLLPTYVLLYNLKLFNTIWVYFIPHGFATFYMILMRNFFEGLPADLMDAARIDGANEWVIFGKIVLPLSMPIIATVAMYIGVWQWNSWLDTQLYITKDELIPMQAILQQILLQNASNDLQAQARLALGTTGTSPETLRMAVVTITTVPIICIYPFFQKYFSKGVMLGAVKA